MDSPAVQGSALGNILALPGEARALITNPFGDALGQGVGVASDIAAGIGNQIAGITPDSLSHGPPVSTPEGFSGVEVPAPPVPEDMAPVIEGDGEIQEDEVEEPFVSEVSPEIQQRLLENALVGEERLRRLGLLPPGYTGLA